MSVKRILKLQEDATWFPKRLKLEDITDMDTKFKADVHSCAEEKNIS
jgi:hypothetical protein